ncbi:MAG: hypothetical protein M3P40_04770 [Actinomycetota bacterium]|nr:hypothetical protein [Actinomycetota bacterium]
MNELARQYEYVEIDSVYRLLEGTALSSSADVMRETATVARAARLLMAFSNGRPR